MNRLDLTQLNGLHLPLAVHTTRGLHSFSYHAAKQWNLLPASVRTSNFADFKRILINLDM